jgi:hypothetical protein
MAGVIGNREFNLRRVPVLFNGIPLSGAADGDFVTVTSSADNYTHAAGSRGEIAVSRNNDESGSIVVRVWQGSTNIIRIIEAAILLTTTRGLQEGTFISFQIADLNTGEKLIMDQCWPTVKPVRNFGPEQQAREYTFNFAELVSVPR